jgi:chromosome segregation ATPase
MAASRQATTSEPAKQTIEELKERYDRLNTKRIEAATNLQNAKGVLKKLQDKAMKDFGTCEVAALRAKLEEMEEANETARSGYQKDLDAVEAALQKIESNLQSTEAGDLPSVIASGEDSPNEGEK